MNEVGEIFVRREKNIAMKQTFIEANIYKDIADFAEVKRYFAKNRKKVKFADDCGLILEKKHYTPTISQTLSKVTNFLHVKANNDECYLESTVTNRNAVLGTIIVRHTDLNINKFRIVYTWDKKVYHSTKLYYPGVQISERFLFKILAPRRKLLDKEQTRTEIVKFYLEYEGKRFVPLNEEFEVKWHSS